MKWLLPSVLGLASLTGCYSGYGYSYYAPVAPPPVRVETYAYAPGPGYVWINGYWGYRNNAYAWNPGRWERPRDEARNGKQAVGNATAIAGVTAKATGDETTPEVKQALACNGAFSPVSA
jgi:hypothetical protein